MNIQQATELTEKDPLKKFREQFYIPKTKEGHDSVYLAGNSLGLQPRKAKEYINQELNDWATFGVEGHFHAKNPWLPYHEFVAQPMARVVGAKPIEVVVMNTLTVNLHLMMVSFYQPTKERFKILIEQNAFPSDRYAVESQIHFHGFDPATALIEVSQNKEDILSTIEREGSKIALVLLGNVNYLTGQAFDMEEITKAGHKSGCRVGFDLAHGAGNLFLKLHDWNVDFAVWCTYKYLNAGPGGLAGCFVHERHSENSKLPRLAGWWGQNKKTRFQMLPNFEPIPGAEGWQLSNPPIFQLAALRASLELFDEATMKALRTKGDSLTGYLETLIDHFLKARCEIVTPRNPKERGSQLSLKVKGTPKDLLKKLLDEGAYCDFREPDIIRVAPVPLYNNFNDVWTFVQKLKAL